MTEVARDLAEQVTAAIAAMFRASEENPPKLMEEGFDGREWTIAWEGPEEWCFEAAWDEDLRAMVIAAGARLEPVNHCQLAIYPLRPANPTYDVLVVNGPAAAVELVKQLVGRQAA